MNRSILKITKTAFDNHYPVNGPFLNRFRKNEILEADVKILAHIIANNAVSFNYIPEELQDKILVLQDRSFFSPKTLRSFSGVSMSGKLYNKYFDHIQLYLPYDANGNVTVIYHACGEVNPIVWDADLFCKYAYANHEIKYVSKIKVSDTSNVINKFMYLEVDKLEKGEKYSVNLE